MVVQNKPIFRSKGKVLLPSRKLIIQDPNYGKTKTKSINNDFHFRIEIQTESRMIWKMVKKEKKTIVLFYPENKKSKFKFENQKLIDSLNYKTESRCFGFGDPLFWRPKIQNRILYQSKGNPSILGSKYGICIFNSHICPQSVKHFIYYDNCHIFVIK